MNPNQQGKYSMPYQQQGKYNQYHPNNIGMYQRYPQNQQGQNYSMGYQGNNKGMNQSSPNIPYTKKTPNARANNIPPGFQENILNQLTMNMTKPNPNLNISEQGKGGYNNMHSKDGASPLSGKNVKPGNMNQSNNPNRRNSEFRPHGGNTQGGKPKGNKYMQGNMGYNNMNNNPEYQPKKDQQFYNNSHQSTDLNVSGISNSSLERIQTNPTTTNSYIQGSPKKYENRRENQMNQMNQYHINQMNQHGQKIILSQASPQSQPEYYAKARINNGPYSEASPSMIPMNIPFIQGPLNYGPPNQMQQRNQERQKRKMNQMMNSNSPPEQQAFPKTVIGSPTMGSTQMDVPITNFNLNQDRPMPMEGDLKMNMQVFDLIKDRINNQGNRKFEEENQILINEMSSGNNPIGLGMPQNNMNNNFRKNDALQNQLNNMKGQGHQNLYHSKPHNNTNLRSAISGPTQISQINTFPENENLKRTQLKLPLNQPNNPNQSQSNKPPSPSLIPNNIKEYQEEEPIPEKNNESEEFVNVNIKTSEKETISISYKSKEDLNQITEKIKEKNPNISKEDLEEIIEVMSVKLNESLKLIKPCTETNISKKKKIIVDKISELMLTGNSFMEETKGTDGKKLNGSFDFSEYNYQREIEDLQPEIEDINFLINSSF